MPLGITQIECSNCGTQNPLSEQIVTADGQKLTRVPSANNYPMAWFKFLIYFALFAGCALNLLNGINYLNGTFYGKDADALYSLSSELKSADTFYACAMFAMIPLALVARFRLAGFCKNGPTLYLALLVVQILVTLIYAFMLSKVGTLTIVTDGSFDGVYFHDATETVYKFDGLSTVLGSVIGSVIMVICNAVYFNKRKELFVY